MRDGLYNDAFANCICAEPSSSAHMLPIKAHVLDALCHMTAHLQDVLFVHPLNINTQPQSMMYMVCDGHSGVEAANFVASNFLRILNTKLPAKLPNFSQPRGACNIAAQSAATTHAQQARAKTFVPMQRWMSSRRACARRYARLLCG